MLWLCRSAFRRDRNGSRLCRSAFRRDRSWSRLKALLLLLPAGLGAAPLPEVVVVASQLRQADLATVPASITLLDPEAVAAGDVQHFEELVPLVPNLNWSGEGSRARYFQVRGTGELEQYEGAPNPSVGFLVDDIDLSGIGGAATSFDVDRIEVLRGPQGTRYGANALAGLVYVQSADPNVVPGAEVTATAGDYGTWALGGVATGPVAGTGDSLTYRVAVQQYESDGFRENAWLGRDDTSNRDELTARAKLRWEGEVATVQLTAFHVDLDNGYDDFAVDGGYTTHSDQPGEDSQATDAAALKATLPLGDSADLVSITGVASSDIVYGFDADWGNEEFWSPFQYVFTQRFDRQRDTVNQDLRLVSRPGSRLLGADWLVGVYALDLDEDITQRDTANCPATTCGEEFIYDVSQGSRYDATSVAGYGELGWSLGAARLTAGLRREIRDAKYRDSEGNDLDPVDRMTGGDITLSYQAGPGATAWARLARGYKAGGFNPGVLRIDPEDPRLAFSPEALWNYEVGVRANTADGRWRVTASVFVQDRDDAQLKIPEQLQPGDPSTFLFVTQNAEEIQVHGVEVEAGWQALESLEFGAALGILETGIDRFSAREELEGRELAHAPGYTFALNATWRSPGGWFARADYTGKDGYAIDYCQVADCNDPETAAYQVLDLRAGREWGAWSVEAWCRNVLDEEYAVRGFYFGNEPPDFIPQLYTRLGDPRHAGVTVKYRL